jgi:hypothetical protein
MTMTEFNEVKDSGAREEFETGARRDTQDGKPRFGLIPAYPLRRLAMHYTNGAKKYGENNWTKGILASRTWESLERHIEAYKEGDKSEDHLAAVAWNAFALIWTEKFRPDLYDLKSYLMWPDEKPAQELTTTTQRGRLVRVWLFLRERPNA